jgi:NAD(P)-dependent dehydrogenase (short-subunit alcohol dehydrogenase family)
VTAGIDPRGAVVAITGGGRGIGRATAAAFVASGARVAIGDLDADVASTTARELGGGVVAYGLDVRSRESFATFVDGVDGALGPIDVLVNNAGLMPIARFLDEADATSAATLDVNVWGPILGMRTVAPGMVERGRGHIVNVSSGLGKVSAPGLSVYSASKHAVVGLSSVVRQELAGTGVTVTTVLPSAVRTELSSGVPGGIGMPRVDPEEIAAAIVRSCRRRPAEVPVPRWIGPILRLGQATPAPLMRRLDGLLGADRALTKLDVGRREAYEARVRRQTVSPTDPTSREDRP